MLTRTSINAQRIRAGGLLRARRTFWIDHHVVVTTLTDSLQSIHASTNIPWYALIPLSTFTLRAFWTLPLSVMQKKRIQKQAEYKSVISATNPVLKLNLGKQVQKSKSQTQALLNDPKVLEHQKAVTAQAPLASMKYEEILMLSAKETRKRQKALFKKHDIQLWKNFVLPGFQIPLWIALSLTMRNLCGWLLWDSLANKPMDPSLYSEGLFWFTDLTSFDHYHITPVILGVAALCNVEWTFKTLELLRLTQRNSLRPTISDSLANLLRMAVVFMMAIAVNAPVGLTLFWISSQVFSLAQNMILDLVYPISYTPKTRRALKEKKDGVAVVNQ